MAGGIELTDAAWRLVPADLPVLMRTTEMYEEIGSIDLTVYSPRRDPERRASRLMPAAIRS
ncbi:MAG TPA: hypothetical protein VM779_14115 [Thermoanaerobaculia bacterium]|nr:hypothetical protein [Thermoanaerobaculia bacterium]